MSLSQSTAHSGPYIFSAQAQSWGSGAIFVVAFTFCWVSLNPFENLADPHAGGRALEQIFGFLLVAGMILYAMARGLLGLLLRPRALIVLLFFWLALSALQAPDTIDALRRLFFSGLICVAASAAVVIPKSREQFTSVIATTAIFMLFVSYLGIFLIPGRAIHQAYDILEPTLAGDWRGVFGHKNITAPAMAILAFIGMYVWSTGAKFKGAMVAVLSLIILIKTDSVTAIGMFPLALVMASILRRMPGMGAFVFVLLLIAVGVLTLGSVFSPTVVGIIKSLGVDPTFTGRVDIWQLAIEAAFQRPLFGYGFSSFWATDIGVGTGVSDTNWAGYSAHAHNSFIDIWLSGGLPALILALVWLVVLPLRDISKATARAADVNLTRLYTRIWVFLILSAFLESNFFAGTGPAWFSLLFAVFGLRLQAREFLVVQSSEASGYNG